MAPTSRHTCVLALLCVASAAAVTPALDTTQNFTSSCRFKQKGIRLALRDSVNVTLEVEGEFLEEETLVFSQDDRNVVAPPDNVTVAAGNVSEVLPLRLVGHAAGHGVLVARATPGNMTDMSEAFVRVAVYHDAALDYVSDVVGWVYFVAWSVSFYPQTYSNWRRKSVIGLHFDFLALNVVGFLAYSVFNVCMYWVGAVQQQYFARHPHGVNPVQLNDVIFSLHALFACLVQVAQCCVYDRGDQRVSSTARVILAGVALASLVATILGASSAIPWLTFLQFISYVKLFITLIKYIPQAYYNYRRKSTSGWSIGNILLDFTGGLLSIAQMFLIAYNYDDWGSLWGDGTKLGLGLFSVVFDVFFMVQHYVLYRGNDHYRMLETPEPRSSLAASSSADYGSMASQ